MGFWKMDWNQYKGKIHVTLWFSNFIWHQSHLEGIFRKKLLGSIARIPNLGGRTQEFIFLYTRYLFSPAIYFFFFLTHHKPLSHMLRFQAKYCVCVSTCIPRLAVKHKDFSNSRTLHLSYLSIFSIFQLILKVFRTCFFINLSCLLLVFFLARWIPLPIFITYSKMLKVFQH